MTDNNDEWKPWEQYPHLWSNRSKFYTWLRGCLRKAVWNQSPIKISFKNQECSPPPEGYTGRAKTGAYCALTGEWEGKSKLDVDHIVGDISLLSEEDILPFIKHLIPPPNTLQLVTKEAHKIKSYAERKGIPFKEALVEKKAIQIIKDKKEKEYLLSNGIEPASNAKQRREQLVELLKIEQEEN